MSLTLGEIANIICDRISMTDVCDVYGLEIRRNFVSCPFHKEDTASLHINKKFWHCFGCGEGGNVIQFVEKLFGLNFRETIIKLDNDFSLGLTNQRVSEEAKQKARELQLRRQKEKELQEQRERYIQQAKNEYLQAWKFLLIYAPFPECPQWDINTDPYLVDQYFKNIDSRYLFALSELNRLEPIADIFDFKIERWEAEEMFLK